MVKQDDQFLFFYYGDDCYSNFFRSEFEFAGVKFFCSEQAFMWAKAVFFRDWHTAGKIANVDGSKRNAPFTCKMLGREVKPYVEEMWESVRYQLMIDVLTQKFSQNLQLYRTLIGTGKLILVEASPTDKLWGVGLAADHPDVTNPARWRGRNLLGNALMEVRDWFITHPIPHFQ